MYLYIQSYDMIVEKYLAEFSALVTVVKTNGGICRGPFLINDKLTRAGVTATLGQTIQQSANNNQLAAAETIARKKGTGGSTSEQRKSE